MDDVANTASIFISKYLVQHSESKTRHCKRCSFLQVLVLLLLLESRGPEAGHSRYLSRHLPKIEQKKSYFLIIEKGLETGEGSNSKSSECTKTIFVL